RALSDGYRSILPHGVYPVALLFIEVPLEEVDVNVHPAKTEVRFRRAPAVADSVREAVQAGLASAGYTPAVEIRDSIPLTPDEVIPAKAEPLAVASPPDEKPQAFVLTNLPQQERIGFGLATAPQPDLAGRSNLPSPVTSETASTAFATEITAEDLSAA